MANTVKKDPLNEYFTKAINDLLKQLDLEEIQPNDLQDCIISSKYQGTNRPETTIIIESKPNYTMLTISFKKGKLTSSGWKGLKE